MASWNLSTSVVTDGCETHYYSEQSTKYIVKDVGMA